jgi:molecular chaperone HscB
MKLDADDFELFDVPKFFKQNRAAIDNRWRALQAEVHPDRFVNQGAQTQRLAMQWAVRVNEAYQRLKNPLHRGAYLCELAGVPVQAESNTAMPSQFLIQQMAWREALAEAQGLPEVLALQDEVNMHRDRTLLEIEHLVDDFHDHVAAVEKVRALMFVERFAQDIDQRLAQMES